MAKMDLCTCMITLGGDARTVVYRGPNNPLTYPEVNLMMFMHGERYVNDIKVVGTRETSSREELRSLQLKYGSIVGEAFPGSRPRLPLEAPEDIPRELVQEPDADTAEISDLEPEPEPEPETEPETAVSPPKRRRRAAQSAA